MDVLGSHYHQGGSVREGGTTQGDHEDHGTEQRHSLAELVHQQFNPTADQCRPVGDAIEGGCCNRHMHVYTLFVIVQECQHILENKST